MNKSSDQDIISIFGQRIRMLRNARGLTQEAFAELTALDRSYVGDVERGKRNASLVSIKKISNAFEISMEKLFQGL